MDKSPREPFRDTVHHQEGLGCQSFLLWQTAVCVWLWGLIFSFQVFVFTFFFLFASTLNHSGSYLWGWNNIRSDILTVLQFPGSQNMGDRTDLTVFFATQIVPRGGKGRSPLKYIIRNNEIFRFRRSFWKVLIQGWEPKADGNSFPGSIHLTWCSPSFVRHPGLHCCCLQPKSTLEAASYGMDFHVCREDVRDLCLMELPESCFSADFQEDRLSAHPSLKGCRKMILTTFKRKEFRLALFPVLSSALLQNKAVDKAWRCFGFQAQPQL